jgi:hypothetical protein
MLRESNTIGRSCLGSEPTGMQDQSARCIIRGRAFQLLWKENRCSLPYGWGYRQYSTVQYSTTGERRPWLVVLKRYCMYASSSFYAPLCSQPASCGRELEVCLAEMSTLQYLIVHQYTCDKLQLTNVLYIILCFKKVCLFFYAPLCSQPASCGRELEVCLAEMSTLHYCMRLDLGCKKEKIGWQKVGHCGLICRSHNDISFSRMRVNWFLANSRERVDTTHLSIHEEGLGISKR